MFSTELYIEYQSGGIHSPNGFSLGREYRLQPLSHNVSLQSDSFLHLSAWIRETMILISSVMTAWWWCCLSRLDGVIISLSLSLIKVLVSLQALPSRTEPSSASRCLGRSSAATFKSPRRTRPTFFSPQSFAMQISLKQT